MDPGSFKNLQDNTSKALVEIVRATGQLASEDLAFHRSLDPTLSARLDRKSERLLALARDLTKSASAGTNLSRPTLNDVESIDDEWKKLVDVLDNLLENADASLDEYSGVIKKPTQTQEESANKALSGSSKRKSAHIHGQAIGKPQLRFRESPANHETTPFKPLLKSKPHARVPLIESLKLIDGYYGSQQYQHPYEQEIKSYQVTSEVLQKRDPIPYHPLNTTTAEFVDTLDGVQSMLSELKQAKEIAVDLEHHDEHSYLGIVSLMQISTRDKDWIIDTLQPWRQDLEILNEVFTDPKIVKVLQGSTMDIIWLQRDLGLYIVGLFDTYHASWALGYPRHGLAYLLKKIVDFDAAKQYQRADWRIRPLPEEMFNYARSDTHFLLYIYDMMRNELIDASEASGRPLIEEVIQNSKQEALQRYERPVYDAERGSGSMGWYNLLSKSPGLFNREQFAVFRAAHQWRDEAARDEDDGPFSVFKNKALFDIARTLPTNLTSLISKLHPISGIVHRRKHDLLRVIKNAKDSSENQPEMKDVFTIIPMQARAEHGQAQSHPTRPFEPLRSSADSASKCSKSSLKLSAMTSAFWGTSLVDTMAPKSLRSAQEIERLSLVLPLPPLDAKVFVDRSKSDVLGEAPRQPVASSRAEMHSPHVKLSKANEVVILRNSNSDKGKIGDENHRPHSWYDTEIQPNQNGADNDQDRDLEDSARRLKKQERRKRKEMKRLARGEPADPNRKGPDEEATLDYETAPSVLHAQNNGDRSKAPKPLKPYNKSLNAPKGLGRAQRDVAGKSMTFGR